MKAKIAAEAVKPVRYTAHCETPECNDRELKFLGWVNQHGLFEHQCLRCYRHYKMPKEYPIIVYEPV